MGLEELIAEKRFCRDKAHNQATTLESLGRCTCANLISVDDLREFVKGKVILDAADVQNLLDYAIKYTPWLDEKHPHRQAYNAVSIELKASTTGAKQ